MKFIGIIPARYASTRFPGKPLKLLGGKPIIQRVYEQVKGTLDDVYVATDDERIEAAFYKHIGLYAYRAEVLRQITAMPQSALEQAESLEQLRWLENGYTITVGVSQVETIGIDTPEDLVKAEEFLRLHGAR